MSEHDVWQFKTDNGEWAPYDDDIQRKIREAKAANSEEVLLWSDMHVLNFAQMRQIWNGNLWGSRPVRICFAIPIDVHTSTGDFRLAMDVSDTIHEVTKMIQEKEGIPQHEQCLMLHGKQVMDGHKLSDFDIQIDMFIMYQNVGETWNAICKDPLQWLQDSLGGHWSHAEVFAQEFNNRRPEQWKLLPKQWKAREVDGFLYRITPDLKKALN